MNAMRKNTAVAVVALMSVFSAAAMAQGPRGDAGKHWAKLNLSERQQTQIKQIEQQYRPAQENRAQMQSQWQQWREQENRLLQSKLFDEVQARQIIQQRQQQHAEFQLQQLKKQHAIFQVLDSKQQQQWLQQKTERSGKYRQQGEYRKPTPSN